MWSLESRSSPFTIITVLCLIQSAVGIRNTVTGIKPNIAHVTTILEIIETILSVCYVHTTYNKCQLWDSMLVAISVLNMCIVHDDQLYLKVECLYITLCTMHEQDSVVDKFYVCYCLHVIQHITYYVSTLLVIKVVHYEHITYLED